MCIRYPPVYMECDALYPKQVSIIEENRYIHTYFFTFPRLEAAFQYMLPYSTHFMTSFEEVYENRMELINHECHEYQGGSINGQHSTMLVTQQVTHTTCHKPIV